MALQKGSEGPAQNRGSKAAFKSKKTSSPKGVTDSGVLGFRIHLTGNSGRTGGMNIGCKEGMNIMG